MNKKNTPEKAEACYSTSFTFVYVRMNFNMAICIFTTLNKFFFFKQKSPVSCEKKNWKRRGGRSGPLHPPVNLWHSVFRICFCLFPFFYRLASSISISFCSQDNWNCIFGSYTQNVFQKSEVGKGGGGVLPFLMDFCCWKKNIFKRQMCAYFCELMLRSNKFFSPWYILICCVVKFREKGLCCVFSRAEFSGKFCVLRFRS